MFSFLCILLGTFQFALLLVLTGFLLSLAIISRLMEVAVTLIYPTSIFLLQQLVKLFVLITSLSARMTGYVWCRTIIRICNALEEETEVLNMNLTTPAIPNERTYSECSTKSLGLNPEKDEEVALDSKSNKSDEVYRTTMEPEDESISNSKEDDTKEDDA
ncbi:uncharacterized protein LOC124427543 isoform X1 [Vespa crabro]|uniref:uncharacterized protein LOC124427543 isoform X1 n=2 Tax=Vespa crabro TaxID=7445 RepID=UPI001F011762|nr:uncharacterized protein LOC124427543 isoform X1 [Vespa crabro]